MIAFVNFLGVGFFIFTFECRGLLLLLLLFLRSPPLCHSFERLSVTVCQVLLSRGMFGLTYLLIFLFYFYLFISLSRSLFGS